MIWLPNPIPPFSSQVQQLQSQVAQLEERLRLITQHPEIEAETLVRDNVIVKLNQKIEDQAKLIAIQERVIREYSSRFAKVRKELKKMQEVEITYN